MFVPFGWSLVHLIQSVIIMLGNFLAIVVFWRTRATLKRTSYLLINLAITDFLIGVGEMVASAINLVPSSTTIPSKLMPVNGLFIFASLFSLVVISLERAVAILKPLLHRTASTRYYVYAMSLVWLLAALMSALHFLDIMFMFIGSSMLFRLAASLYLLSLLVIFSSYLAIWCRASKRVRVAQSQNLAVTLFIMTMISVVTLVPNQVTLMMSQSYKPDNHFSLVVLVTSLFLYASYMVNPFLFAFRMPRFRNEIKLLCRRTHLNM